MNVALPQLVDDRCTSCGDYLWRSSVTTDTGDVVVDACPTCDRPRCKVCKAPYGRLLQSAPAVVEELTAIDDRCDPCLAAT